MNLSKKFLVLVAAGFLAVLPMWGFAEEAKTEGQAPAAKAEEVKTDGKAPDIKFDNVAFDCGEIFQGEKCEHVYKVFNKGTAPLALDRVQASCGCTSTIMSEKEIAPGKEGSIQAVFDSTGKSGPQTKTITVYSNDPDEPQARLTLTAKVKVEVEVNPSRLYFGRYEKNNPEDKEVRVTGQMDKPLEISSIDSDNESLKYSIADAPEKDGSKVIKVGFNEKVPIGRFAGRLTLNTNSAKQAKVEIFVNANIIGDVEVSPERLFFAPFPEGETRSQTVTITDKKGKGGFKVSKYEDHGGFLDVALETVTEGKEYRLVCTTKKDIKMDALQNGRFNGEILVETNNPQEGTFTIQYNGYLKQQGAEAPLQVNPQ